MVLSTLSRSRSTFAVVAVLVVTGCTPGPATGTAPTNTAATAGAAGRALPAEPAGPGHVLEGALHGPGARLTVRDAASRVDVRTADLPGRLYRITTPADSSLAPRITGSAARLRLDLEPTGDDGPDTVTVVLNRSVRWDIRLPAGAGEQRLDLARGRVDRLELGASGLVTVHLPRPRGTVPVTLTGGAGSVELTVPRATRTLVRLRRGAGAVSTPWRSSNGTRPGAVLAARGWSTSTDRYAVEARKGLGTLTVR